MQLKTLSSMAKKHAPMKIIVLDELFLNLTIVEKYGNFSISNLNSKYSTDFDRITHKVSQLFKR